MRSLNGPDLEADPFRLVAEAGPAAREKMGEKTLVMVGAVLPEGDGFYLLARGSGVTDDPGHGEALLDEECGERTPLAEP